MPTKKDELDAAVDEGSEESFPASDPPSYMAGAAVAGSPQPPDLSNEQIPQQGADLAQRIRERAYFLWEEEGRPEGRADEEWLTAEREEAERERKS